MFRDAFVRIFRHPPREEASASGQLLWLVMVAGAIVFFVWWYDRVNTARWDVLQQLLQLPPGVERTRFSASSTDKSFEELRSGTAEVVFSDAQLRDYTEILDGVSRRQPGPDSVNRVRVVSYSARSLAWTKPPLTNRVGDRRLQPDGLFPAASEATPDLRVFCMVFHDPRAWNDPSPRLVYYAKGCSELGPKENASILVVAVMDVTARTLRIRVE